jgi:NAD(P)-dependent dehydrogenase (short-subunit alcohol dehydrogenase family)
LSARDAGPRVVVITGASSGIGRAAAHRLAARGDRLVLASRGKAALDTAAEECLAAGARSVTVRQVDVRDAAAVQCLVDETLAEHPRIDAVLHAAGVVAYGAFTDIPEEIFDAVLATNLHGAVHVARSALPVFRRQRRGSLQLVGSVLGDIAAPGMTPYVVAKHGVRSLGRQLALENRDLPDVHVTVVSPGGVDTPIYRRAANYLGRPGRPPAPVVGADAVARAMVAALDRPRDRVSVGPANYVMRAGFSLLPGVFDALVGPLFRLIATKPEPCPPTAGNVLRPRDESGTSEQHVERRDAEMATNSRLMKGLAPRDVFDVLRDGRSYEDWVVGTRRIRAVDPDWPQAGSSIHYTVGYSPFRKDDQTLSIAYEPDRRLALEAQAWPAGSASIVITAEPADGGTLVTIDEAPNRGLAKTLHNPLLDLLIKMRNVETLRRLEAKARERAGQKQR